MKKTLYIKLFFILFVLILSFINVNAKYLEPIEVNGEDCFDVYEVIKIKNGIVENKNDVILGNGKSFFINNNFLSIYENSIVYKINNEYTPIETTTYSSNGFQINLPKNTYKNIKENPFYLTKKQLKKYFLLDVENQGILYEKEIEVKEQPDGVSIEFLQQNIASLGFVDIGNNTYKYDENENPNIVISFYDDHININWYYLNTSQEKLNLLIQALYPNSYSIITNNLIESEGTYDNRYYSCKAYDEYLEITIK